ncbi:MAG: tRNA-dihydrouridine synthase, partial [Pseudomonadota bacterium]|nr:tRNA-dihydrouridine synthase [Pseudomonadota bacterium]
MAIQVGAVSLNDHILLAPMSGVTDVAYRATLKSLGADVTISEMVASNAIIKDESDELRKIQKIDDRT